MFVISRFKSGQAVVVVLDGYVKSPKDQEHIFIYKEQGEIFNAYVRRVEQTSNI